MESGWLRSNQIESARRTITNFIKRGGKIWIRVFPDKPRTQKGAEVGMGGGAGSLSHFVANAEAGRIIFEMDGVSEEMAREAFRLAGHKLPIKTKFIKKWTSLKIAWISKSKLSRTRISNGVKFSEIQNKEGSELNEMLKNARIKLGQLKFELANKTLKNPSQIKPVKKEIARLMTALNNKHLNI